MRTWFPAALACVVIVTAACDHTRLRGTIQADRREVRVGETLELTLVVPAELDAIHKVIWEVKPPGAGKLDYERAAEGTAGRVAQFTGLEAGTVRVVAAGFYKQTNPQNITEIELTVVE